MFLRVPVVHQLVSSRLSISPPPPPFHSWTKWGGELKDAATQLLQRLISTASYYSGLETLARSAPLSSGPAALWAPAPSNHADLLFGGEASSRRSALNVRRQVDDDDAHVKLHLGSFGGGRMGAWRVFSVHAEEYWMFTGGRVEKKTDEREVAAAAFREHL